MGREISMMTNTTTVYIMQIIKTKTKNIQLTSSFFLFTKYRIQNFIISSKMSVGFWFEKHRSWNFTVFFLFFFVNTKIFGVCVCLFAEMISQLTISQWKVKIIFFWSSKSKCRCRKNVNRNLKCRAIIECIPLLLIIFMILNRLRQNNYKLLSTNHWLTKKKVLISIEYWIINQRAIHCTCI